MRGEVRAHELMAAAARLTTVRMVPVTGNVGDLAHILHAALWCEQ